MTALDSDDRTRDDRSTRDGVSAPVDDEPLGTTTSVGCYHGFFFREFCDWSLVVTRNISRSYDILVFKKYCDGAEKSNASAPNLRADPAPVREDTRARSDTDADARTRLVLVCPVPSRSALLLRSASCFPPLGAAAPPRRFVAGWPSLGGKLGSRACMRLRRRTAPRLPPNPTTRRTSTSRHAPRLCRRSKPSAFPSS